MTAVDGEDLYTYDANGNMTTRLWQGITQTLVYDDENRLVAVQGPVSATFGYDGDGARVLSVISGTTTVHLGASYEWDETAQVATQYYSLGGRRLAWRTGGALQYLHGDHLSSTTVVSAEEPYTLPHRIYLNILRSPDVGAAAGDGLAYRGGEGAALEEQSAPEAETVSSPYPAPEEVEAQAEVARRAAPVEPIERTAAYPAPEEGERAPVEEETHAEAERLLTEAVTPPPTTRYAPYGAIRSTHVVTTPYRYTGQRQEELLGLYYYQARWYDPALGRFLQADTVVPEPGNPQAYNRYAYVYGNPIRYVDPDGHFPILAIAALAVFAAVAISGDSTVGAVSGDAQNAAVADVALAVACDPYDIATTLSRCARGECNGLDYVGLGLPLIPSLGKIDNVLDAAKHADGVGDSLVGLRRFATLGPDSISGVLSTFGDDSRAIGRVPDAFSGRRVTTIGRVGDTAVAKEIGERVIEDGGWSLETNYQWLADAIDNGDVIYLASPVKADNLVSLPRYGGVTVYARELDALLQAGYQRVGDYLIPPQ